jgi:hypothetical protein
MGRCPWSGRLAFYAGAFVFASVTGAFAFQSGTHDSTGEMAFFQSTTNEPE